MIFYLQNLDFWCTQIYIPPEQVWIQNIFWQWVGGFFRPKSSVINSCPMVGKLGRRQFSFQFSSFRLGATLHCTESLRCFDSTERWSQVGRGIFQGGDRRGNRVNERKKGIYLSISKLSIYVTKNRVFNIYYRVFRF